MYHTKNLEHNRCFSNRLPFMGNCLAKNSPGKENADGEVGTKFADVQELQKPNRYVAEPKSPSAQLPQPEVPPPTPTWPLYVALYDYDARTREDLSFKRGEILEVKPEDLSNDWWLARLRGAIREGYIPSNYVAPAETLEAEP